MPCYADIILARSDIILPVFVWCLYFFVAKTYFTYRA